MNISFWKHHPVADQTGRQLAEQTLAFQHQFKFDLVKLTPAGNWLAVCYGLEDVWRNDRLGRRESTRPFITHPDDWYTLADFQRSAPPILEQQLLAAKLTRSACSDKPVYATVFSPISQAVQLAGIDQILDHWQHYPAQLTAGLNQLTQNLCFVLDQFSQLALQGLYYVIQHARVGGLPQAEHRQFSALADEPCLSKATRLFTDVIVHLHGQEVYWPLDALPPTLAVHYTACPAGIAPNLGHLSPLQPLLPAIPTDVLMRCPSLEVARQTLASYYPPGATSNSPHVMGECVLPLDFPSTQIELWKQAAKLTR